MLPKSHLALTQLYTMLFFRDRAFLLMTSIAFVGNLALWILLVWQFNILYQPGRDYIALHYKVVFGVDWLGQWYHLFLLPTTGALIFVIHYALAKHSYHHQKVLIYIFMSSAIVCQFLLVFALYLIIQANLF